MPESTTAHQDVKHDAKPNAALPSTASSAPMPKRGIFAATAADALERAKADREAQLKSPGQVTELIRMSISELWAGQEALQAATEVADPVGMLAAIAQLRALLTNLHTCETAGAKLESTAGDAASPLRAALDLASNERNELTRLLEIRETQAKHQQALRTGKLEAIAPNHVVGTPEEVRKEANRLAPLGLCDDKSVQSPTSQICPLETQSREVLRDSVKHYLGGISAAWSTAISNEQLVRRLAPLLTSGSNPLLQIFIDVALTWVSGGATALLGDKIYKAGAAIGGAIAPPIEGAAAGGKEVAAGLASRLADFAKDKFTSSGGGSAADLTKTFIESCRNSQEAWADQAYREVQQVTDPMLVALAKSAEQNPFRTAYFEHKLKQLAGGFDAVADLYKTPVGEHSERYPVWVFAPTGERRLAIVQQEVLTSTPARGTGMGSRDAISFSSEKIHFRSWVDSTLTSSAIANASAHKREIQAMTADSSQWINNHEPSVWAKAPDSRPQDVHVAPRAIGADL